MKMHTSYRLALVLIVAAVSLRSQPSQLQIVLPAPPPTSIGARVVGNMQGGQNVFYWVIVNYSNGSVASQTAVANTVGIQNLNTTNYVVLTWASVAGAVSYDIVRSTTPAFPGSCASCAVLTATTLLTTNDQSPTGTAYTQSAVASGASAVWTLDNSTESAPFVNLTLNGNMLRIAPLTGSYVAGHGVIFAANGRLADGGAAPATGTVTSVGLTMPSIFSVAGSPVTTSGTLAVTLTTETANTVLAGPTSGGAATPTFRALVAADIPAGGCTTCVTAASALTLNKIITGSGLQAEAASNVTLTNPATTATITPADNSSLITAGAFSLTLTATATTNSTFPAGTHNLAPLDTPIFTTNITTPLIKPPADSTTALQITKADGSTVVIDVDTTNSRVGIGKTPSVTFDVNGAMAGSSLSVTGNIQAGASNFFIISGKSAMTSASNGSMSFFANDGTTPATIIGGGLTISGASVTYSGLGSATGTPDSACFNVNTFTRNAALTCTVSNEDVKNHFQPLQAATADIMRIVPAQFEYNDAPGRLRWGFGAKQIAGVSKELADGWHADGTPWSLDQNAILALTVKAVQELKTAVAQLSAR